MQCPFSPPTCREGVRRLGDNPEALAHLLHAAQVARVAVARESDRYVELGGGRKESERGRIFENLVAVNWQFSLHEKFYTCTLEENITSVERKNPCEFAGRVPF